MPISQAGAAWWIAAGCGLAVLGLGVLTTGAWAGSTVRLLADLMKVDQAPQSVGPR